MDTIKNARNINDSLFGGKASIPTVISMIETGMLPGNIEDVEKFKREWKRTFTGCFLVKYPRYYGIIEKISRVTGSLPVGRISRGKIYVI